MNRGFVYLVGAGPGDPDLISVKGMKALEKAECIIYDYLANPLLFRNIKCEIIYVGKQGGNHTLKQDEINKLLVEKALEGKRVVRLKGGDPYIFGRGGEEVEFLLEHNIGFTVIPGISSFYSAPAYAGIPITHRDYVNAFEVVTGHRKDDATEEEDINFPDFRKEKSFAFLMGMKNLDYISRKLIDEKNFPSDIPVAIVSNGTTPKQRCVTGKLSEIARIAEDSKMKPPAIILIGEVVNLRDRLNWFEKLPLFGKRIVVTRSREQASKLSERLIELGAAVTELPTIEIIDRGDNPELGRALQNINDYSWIVFTSQNAVKIFFRELFERGDARSLANAKIAAIGEATANELRNCGIIADLIPEKFVAESLIDSFSRIDINGKKMLIPCSADARETLKDGLQNLGAEVERIHIYETASPSLREEIIEEARNADVVTFTSSSTAINFFKIAERTDALVASIGPITSEAVRKSGHSVTVEAEVYTIDGLVDAIVKHFRG